MNYVIVQVGIVLVFAALLVWVIAATRKSGKTSEKLRREEKESADAKRTAQRLARRRLRGSDLLRRLRKPRDDA